MRAFTFKRNRVARVYKGGLLLDKLQGIPAPSDSYQPEEWLASTVLACNDASSDPLEGISVALFEGKEIPFTELAKLKAEALFGKEHFAKHGASPGFLTKLLDSAIRLPLQAHPDCEKAASLYNSKYGKTEAWIILDGRNDEVEKPYLLLGFNENLNEELFRREALSGKMSRSLEMFHKYCPALGEVFLINGGLPHAIGPGNFIMEIMEPSDWVVQPERFCWDRELSIAERYGDVEPNKALDVFHFTREPDSINKARLNPLTLDVGKGYSVISLIDRNAVKFFGAMKLKLSGQWSWNSHGTPFAVGVITKGCCEVISEKHSLRLRGGDSIFIPFSCGNTIFRGNAEIIFALPPCL